MVGHVSVAENLTISTQLQFRGVGRTLKVPPNEGEGFVLADFSKSRKTVFFSVLPGIKKTLVALVEPVGDFLQRLRAYFCEVRIRLAGLQFGQMLVKPEEVSPGKNTTERRSAESPTGTECGTAWIRSDTSPRC